MRQLVQKLGLSGVVTALLLTGLAVLSVDNATAESTKKGWLGVTVQELTPSLKEAFKTGNRDGLLINSVVAGSPADDAGLREEDVILRYDGKSLAMTDDLTDLVRATAPRTTVKLRILRDGEEKSIDVRIGRHRSRSRGLFSVGGDNAFVLASGPRLGVQVQKMNADLADYFRVKAGEGVLVLSVNEESPAEKAGLKAGDVITTVSGDPVGDPSELIETLADFDEGDKVEVAYIRKGSRSTASVELDGQDAWSYRMKSGKGPNVFFRGHGDNVRFFPDGGFGGMDDLHIELDGAGIHHLRDRIRNRVKGDTRIRVLDGSRGNSI